MGRVYFSYLPLLFFLESLTGLGTSLKQFTAIVCITCDGEKNMVMNRYENNQEMKEYHNGIKEDYDRFFSV